MSESDPPSRLPKPSEVDSLGLYSAFKELGSSLNSEERQVFQQCRQTLVLSLVGSVSLTTLIGALFLGRMKKSYAKVERTVSTVTKAMVYGLAGGIGVTAGVAISTKPCIMKILQLSDESKIKLALREE